MLKIFLVGGGVGDGGFPGSIFRPNNQILTGLGSYSQENPENK